MTKQELNVSVAMYTNITIFANYTTYTQNCKLSNIYMDYSIKMNQYLMGGGYPNNNSLKRYRKNAGIGNQMNRNSEKYNKYI